MTNGLRSGSGLLQHYRRIAALTQEQLAERAGLSVRTIRNLEHGLITSPRVRSVRLLADALELADADRALLLRAGPGPQSCGTPVPRQLPPTMRRFPGRIDELRCLDRSLEQVPVAVISGAAGVGKTTLAGYWAAKVADRFPDGQLYADFHCPCQADAEPVSPDTVLSVFLQALGVSPDRIPAEQLARIGLYRSLLAGQRVLVLLDNVRDARQVRPLLPGGQGCFTVITSRDGLDNLIAADAMHAIILA